MLGSGALEEPAAGQFSRLMCAAGQSSRVGLSLALESLAKETLLQPSVLNL